MKANWNVSDMVWRALYLLLLLCTETKQPVGTPVAVAKLMKAYPQYITGYKDNKLLFSDGTSMLYDDGKVKTKQQLLDNADIEDQFAYTYKTGKYIAAGEDPGRIRNEAFFKKLYGTTAAAVEKKLVTINWCPKLAPQKIRVTTVNGLDKIVKQLSDELDNHPEFKKYVSNIGGTFNWRKISGSEHLSTHSFGCTIDINVKYSAYWQWNCKCKDENAKLTYTNRIPETLVALFEKHGFIWGGKWYHYDTMHFEYRPELLP
jgi:D-alanyl-D-alanine carboxypeptidase-like protein